MKLNFLKLATETTGLNKINKVVDDSFAGIMSLLKNLFSKISGLSTIIAGIVLLILVLKAMNETKKGHPDAWKDEANKLIIVSILLVISMVIFANFNV